MFLLNSRLLLFTAAPVCYGSKSLHTQGHPFFRSYGVSWPSSLTTILPITLGFSPRLPESVCGTDTCCTHYEDFLGSVESGTLLQFPGSHSLLEDDCPADLPTEHLYKLGPRLPSRGCPVLLLPPLADNAQHVVAECLRHVHHLRLSAST